MKRKNLFILLVLFLLLLPLSYLPPISTSAKESQKLEVLVEGLDSDGDCILIRCGEVQILIDAARTYDAYQKIEKDLQEWTKDQDDKVWDYMIFTHPDADHIGNAVRVMDYFIPENEAETKTDWCIGTIIDYGDGNDEENNEDTDVAKKYKKRLDDIKTHSAYFDASTLTEENNIQEYRISEVCSLKILYHKNIGKVKSNDRSVCCLIEYGEQKLLFTGDLEESGETYLKNNYNELIDGVTFFKAGHHGSKTSNTEEFVDLIRPEYVAITLEKNASGLEDTLANFLKYTDFIYPTYVEYAGQYYKLFGSVSFIFDGEKTIVKSEDEEITGERKNIRNASIHVYENDEDDDQEINWYEEELRMKGLKDEIMVYTLDLDGETPYYGNCTLIKYGNLDILIDCGSTITDTMGFVEKLKRYVVDRKIEYLIVTHYHVANISQLIGNYRNGNSLGNGVLNQFEIGKIIDGEKTNLSNAPENGFYKKYLKLVNSISGRESLKANNNFEKEIISGKLSLKVIGNSGMDSEDEDDYSLCVLINFYEKKFLFVGDTNDYTRLLEDYKNEIKNVTFFRLSNSVSIDEKSYEKFIKVVNPQFCVYGSPLNYRMSNGGYFADLKMQNKILEIMKNISPSNIYFCGYINDDNVYFKVNSDLVFRLWYYQDKTGGKIEGQMFSNIKGCSPVSLDETIEKWAKEI